MTIAVVALAIVVSILGALVISLLRSHADILRVLNDAGIDLDPANAGSTDDRQSESPSSGGRSSAHGSYGSGVSNRSAPVGHSETLAGVSGDLETLGSGVSDITGITPEGDAVSIGVASTDSLVAFLSSGCVTCHRFWEAFASGEALTDGRLEDGTRVVVVTQGEETESPATVADLSTPEVPVVMSSDAWEDFGVPVAPYFVLVSGGQVVGEGAAAQWSQVASLLAKARADLETVRSHPNHTGHPRNDENPRSRRSVITGNRDRVDADLLAAGIHPGDPRLTHGPSDVGLSDEPAGDPLADAPVNGGKQ